MIFNNCIIDNRDELTEKIVSELRSRQENLVLIGMPGVGKTTVGRALAEKLGREFFDTDKMIVEREGRQITEIFETEGEDYFRSVESAVAMEAGQKTGAVIACGGGIVMNEENFYSLAENSRFIFLDKPLSEDFADEDRPVTKSVGIERLYRLRYPLYISWADEKIGVSGLKVEEILEQILGENQADPAGSVQR